MFSDKHLCTVPIGVRVLSPSTATAARVDVASFTAGERPATVEADTAPTVPTQHVKTTGNPLNTHCTCGTLLPVLHVLAKPTSRFPVHVVPLLPHRACVVVVEGGQVTLITHGSLAEEARGFVSCDGCFV